MNYLNLKRVLPPPTITWFLKVKNVLRERTFLSKCWIHKGCSHDKRKDLARARLSLFAGTAVASQTLICSPISSHKSYSCSGASDSDFQPAPRGWPVVWALWTPLGRAKPCVSDSYVEVGKVGRTTWRKFFQNTHSPFSPTRTIEVGVMRAMCAFKMHC